MADEQVTPTTNDGPIIQELVIHDLQERLAHGIKVYGTGLQIDNGRDMIRDAYEEAMDLTVYLKGMQEMRKEVILLVRHIARMHATRNSKCVVCDVAYPCHEQVDLDRILDLLGFSKYDTQ